MQESKVEAAPAIGISLTHTVAENRNIVMQCFVPFDCSTKELNDALDKCFKASQRQFCAVRLPQAKKDLLRLQKAYERAVEDMLRLDVEAAETDRILEAQHAASNKRGEMKLSPQQNAMKQKNAADRSNAETSLKRGQTDIRLLEEEIIDLEKTIAED